jgi:hypothetical protein
MKNIRTGVLVFAVFVPLAALASDGYLEWTSVEFEDAAGWRVHIAQAGDRTTDGFTHISKIDVSKRGVAVKIPETATAEIRDPMLNEAKLLSVCCADTVRLQIPVFRSSGPSSERHVWELTIVGGKFAGASERVEHVDTEPYE